MRRPHHARAERRLHDWQCCAASRASRSPAAFEIVAIVIGRRALDLDCRTSRRSSGRYNLLSDRASFRFKFFNPSADEPNGVWEASLTQGGFVAVNSIDGAKHVANLSIKF
jgi:hypothetical protein